MRQQLDAQLNENEMVLDEFKRLKDPDANVYKLIGSALIKQDRVEAQQNVSKRLDFIKGEMYVCWSDCSGFRILMRV